MNLVKAELRKLFYQRSTYGLILGTMVLSVLGTAFSPYAMTRISKGGPMLPLSSPDVVDSVYSKSLGGYIFVLIIGVLMMAGEFHHHTAVATFLASPRRSRVLAAKLGVAAVIGALINVAAAWVGIASGAIALSLFKNVAQPHDYIWGNYTAAAAVTGGVLAVVGVAVGTLIRNQNAAVTGSLVWLMVVDRILAVIWTEIGKYLPTGLITAMMNLHLNIKDKPSGLGINTADYLDPVPAALLLLGYGVVFAAAAAASTLRRDIE